MAGEATGEPPSSIPATGEPASGLATSGVSATGDPATGDPATGDPATGEAAFGVLAPAAVVAVAAGWVHARIGAAGSPWPSPSTSAKYIVVVVHAASIADASLVSPGEKPTRPQAASARTNMHRV